MFTRTRRPQGYQVRKSRVQRPLDFFAQEGLQVDPVRQDDPPEEEGIYDRIVKFFVGEEDEPQRRLSHPRRPTNDGPNFGVIKGGELPYDDDASGSPLNQPRLIKEPTQQPQVQTQQPQGGRYMPNQAERKEIQMFYESSGNPNARSKYAGGLYGVSPAALTDAVKDGVVPEGSNVYDPEVNEKVRDYYMTKSYNTEWVKNATNNLSRLMRSYEAYNQGGQNALRSNEAAKKDGHNINPTNYEEAIKLLDATGPSGKYDGGHYWPKETRDYVKGTVLGDVDPSRLPEGFQLGQMDGGGKMGDKEPIDPKKMAMYNEAFKKTMGDNYGNVPPEMMANITNLVAGGDLLSKTDQINAQLSALRELGLDTDLLFENLTEAEGGGFGAKMKYGAAARMFSE